MATRTVTLALVDSAGRALGTLRLPRPTRSPWWQEVDEVVDLTGDAHGIDVTVLRLLRAGRSRPPGGAVTYLAEYDGPPPRGLVPAGDTAWWTAPHPLRMPWADPGGPAATLEWATGVLAGHGRTVVGRHQRRTWNLSSIWRLDTDRGRAWVKEVPPFFAHEGALLRWLDRPTTPVVLGADGGRLLLDDVPGADRYDADATERAPMLAELLEIQFETAGRVPELLALGVPDLRAEAFCRRLRELARELPMAELLADLPERFAALAECGVPDTLVHGDFHPGNVRRDGASRVVIDWGDSVVGHPALDLLRMRDWEAGSGPAPELAGLWCAFWRRRVPGSHPERAVELMTPLAAIRDALVYRDFVRSIEPAERPYHAADVLAGVRRALDLHKTSQHA